MDRDRVGQYISPYYDNEIKQINRKYDGKNESKLNQKPFGLHLGHLATMLTVLLPMPQSIITDYTHAGNKVTVFYSIYVEGKKFFRKSTLTLRTPISPRPSY